MSAYETIDHLNVVSYARQIAYLRDPDTIRAACVNQYRRSPSLETIRQIVAKHFGAKQGHYSNASDQELEYNPVSDRGTDWRPRPLPVEPEPVEEVAPPPRVILRGPIGRTIIAETAKTFGMTVGDLLSERRSARRVCARAVAVRLLRERTYMDGRPRFSFPEIGRMMHRDHSSVIHLWKTFDTRAARYPVVMAVYLDLHEAFNG